ncbi:hypothetical protein [Streptomyces sp. NPDC003247]|uniref:hypothetical protein n=1 Tax=Streptomyces sp. NPDC003247 TaxID=3364677 RepID=UPI0036999365
MTVAFSVAALPVTAVTSTHTLGVSTAAAGILTAAHGLGNLAGSAGVMIRPSRAEADRPTTRLAAAVAATLLLITLTPSFPLAVTAYAGDQVFVRDMPAQQQHFDQCSGAVPLAVGLRAAAHQAS